jgi:hypothetical protein
MSVINIDKYIKIIALLPWSSFDNSDIFHHVHTTQIFSVKRMQHTAKQRLLCFSLWSQSK